MKTALVEIESVSPYSQSRFHDTPKRDKELPDEHEQRTWRERCHTTEDGNIFIPPMAFKNSIQEAAKYLSLKVKGKGQATWTKHFEAGILVTDGLTLPEKKDDIAGEWFFMNADGKRGSGTRVKRCYPVVPKWSGKVTFYILDDQITEDIFRYHLEQAGNLIGIGRFRPRNGGFYGRFKVLSVKWVEQKAA
jgi:hypothetical protein